MSANTSKNLQNLTRPVNLMTRMKYWIEAQDNTDRWAPSEVAQSAPSHFQDCENRSYCMFPSLNHIIEAGSEKLSLDIELLYIEFWKDPNLQ